jgi:hypothetical protein
MRAHLIAATLVASLTTPALADMYYVVWDTATKRCLLSNIPPNGKARTLIGVTAYLTRDEAKAGGHEDGRGVQDRPQIAAREWLGGRAGVDRVRREAARAVALFAPAKLL